MKKLMVLAVVFALTASGVFAQDTGAPTFRVNGWVGTGASLIGGNSEADGVEGLTAGNNTRGNHQLIGRLNATGETADGKFGGFVRVGVNDTNPNLRARAWWVPNSIFKVTVGAVD
jgi:hypothetical protein